MIQSPFIAFEGIDGSGKSTQAAMLAATLTADGHRVHLTSEPTGGPIGAMIRNIFNHRQEADHRTIAGLFVADRLDHLLNNTDGIVKMRNEGFIVISDRYYFSSYAYQGAHMPMDWVIAANSLSAGILRPDLNIFIDVPPEICMERISHGRNSTELYETLDNLKCVRSRFFEAFEKTAAVEKIRIIDGNRAPEEIAADIRKEILTLIKTQ